MWSKEKFQSHDTQSHYAIDNSLTQIVPNSPTYPHFITTCTAKQGIQLMDDTIIFANESKGQ